MLTEQQVLQLLDRRKPGFSLAADFYLDDAIFSIEMAAIFEKQWLLAGNACELPEVGDYLLTDVGRNSIIVIRSDVNTVEAFYNSCRHRGSRLCAEPAGNKTRLVCPYHHWTYDLSGRLQHAQQMGESFKLSDYALKRVHLTNVCGVLYVCLADTPPEFDYFKNTVSPFIEPHQPARTKVACEISIIEKANWKLVIENNRECYHCEGNHPELLSSLTSFALPDDPTGDGEFHDLMRRKTADWDALGLPHRPADGRGKFRCIRLPFINSALTMSLDGELISRRLLGHLEDPDLGSVRMFHVPGNWNHFASDHIIHFSVHPLSAHETRVTTKWLVHEDAVEGWDYDIQRLTAVWKATNEQDQRLAENNFLGIQNKGYEPGPYSPVSEFMCIDFTNWYAAEMENHLLPPAPLRIVG